MLNLEKDNTIKIFINTLIESFFAGFGKITKYKDIEKANSLIDKLLIKNFTILKETFYNEDETKLFEYYKLILEKLKCNGKYRYTKFNIGNI